MYAESLKRLRGLAQEQLESDQLRERMSLILRQTADALHDGPLENGYWSWHNLPALAEELQEQLRSRPRSDDLDVLLFGWWWRKPWGWLLQWRKRWNRSSSRQTSV
jgi:hypothetical protein